LKRGFDMTATAYTAALAPDSQQQAAAQQAQQRAENNMHLTPGQYKGLALVCVLLGVWASWITWRFFVHGSQAMEADPSVLEISIAAATMFIVCEMGAFALAKMLPAERLYALRWQLLAFAGAMLVFECVTIILTQRGITAAADMHAKAVDSRASQLQASIEAQRAGAAALRDTGAHSSKSVFMASRTDGTASVRQSLEVEQRLATQADELAKVQLERKPTATELLGENGALYYAIARGLLVSCAGLVFFGAAGALLRAARTADASGAAAAGAAAGVNAGAGGPHGANYSAPGVAPQPANDGRFSVPAAAKTGTGYGRTWAWGAAAVPLAFTAAASFAPKPAQASPWLQAQAHSASPSALKAEHPGAPKAEHPAPANVAPSPAQQASSASPEAGVQPPGESPTESPTDAKRDHPGDAKRDHFAATAPSKAKKAARRSLTVPGVKVDTGVGERDGARYQRVREGVLTGRIKPSQRGIQAAEGGGIKTVRGYLAELEREGVTHRHGQGWKLNQEVAA
jgi:hypothetical protein